MVKMVFHKKRNDNEDLVMWEVVIVGIGMMMKIVTIRKTDVKVEIVMIVEEAVEALLVPILNDLSLRRHSHNGTLAPIMHRLYVTSLHCHCLH